jgi:pyruvate/2-oxoglutarate dehydrogenase complex dihydrolipoamide acyltransferase (E2) component
MIHSLIEVDVTDLRAALKSIARETGSAPSITAAVIAACARAVEQAPIVHAYRTLGNTLVLFKDVDVSVPVERVVAGANQVVATIVRAANRKAAAEIHEELQTARREPAQQSEVGSSIRLYLLIPPFIRRLVFRLIDRFPRLMKKRAGTIMVTAVGMYGTGAGWGIALTGHTLGVTVGSIVPRARVVDGRVEERDHLCLSVSFDHDIVDGAPAARYIRRLRSLVERQALPLSAGE